MKITKNQRPTDNYDNCIAWIAFFDKMFVIFKAKWIETALANIETQICMTLNLLPFIPVSTKVTQLNKYSTWLYYQQ